MGPTHVAQSPRGGAVTSGLEQQCWPWGAWLYASDSESDTPGPGCYAGDVLVPARLRLSGKQVWRRSGKGIKMPGNGSLQESCITLDLFLLLLEDKVDSQPDELWEVSGSFSMLSANRVSAH